MPKSQSQPPASEPGDLGDLPGFRADPGAELDHPDEQPATSPTAPSTTSAPPTDPTSSSPATGAPSEDSGPSSPASTEPPPRRFLAPGREPLNLSAELRGELENLTGGVFELGGHVANRFMQRRSHSSTRLWLVAEDEAEDFGAAAGRILARRIPEELAEGDGADLVIMGSVVLGYTMRNMAGQPAPATGEQLAVYTGPGPSQQPAATQPPPAEPSPSPPAAASPAAPVRAGSPVVVGVEAATPPPPFSPDL